MGQQMAERRERILTAAREIIGERGYEALTMRDLARAGRVTVPTIYNLIGSKEDVLFAAVEEQTAEFVAGIERIKAKTAADQVLELVNAVVRELLRLPRYYRSLPQLLYTSDAASPAQAEVSRALGRQLARAVDGLRECGDLVDWVDRRALVDRMGADLAYTSLQWAGGQLSRQGLRAASLYGVCLILMGVVQGESRAEFERVAREAQPRATGRPRPAPAQTHEQRMPGSAS